MLLPHQRLIKPVLILFSLTVILIALQAENFFEDGLYAKSTIAQIINHDFNVLPFVNDQRAITENNNYPNFIHIGISAYHLPFFLYQYFLNLLTNHNTVAVENYYTVNIFFLACFLVAGFYLLKDILVELGCKQPRLAIIFAYFSTTTFWYTVFSSTNANALSGILSIAALWLFLKDKEKKIPFWLWGLAAGIGFAVRIQLLWIFIILCWRIYEENKDFVKNSLLSLWGFFAVYLLMLINRFLMTKTFSTPLNVYFEGYLFSDFALQTWKYIAIGPNGYFATSPVLLIVLFGFGLAAKEKRTVMIVPLTALAFDLALICYYHSSWVIVDEFVGRLQLDFFFCYAIFLGVAIDYFYEKKPVYKILFFIILCLSLLYHLKVALSFQFAHYYNQDWEWQIARLYLRYNLQDLFIFLQQRWMGIQWLTSLQKSLPFLPFIIFLVYLAQNGQSQLRKTLLAFFVIPVFLFALMTTSNLLFNQSNAEKLSVSNKVMARGYHAQFFDDFIDEYKKVSLYYISINDCKRVKKLYDIKELYLKKVIDDVLVDPVNFKTKISTLDGQVSANEEPELTTNFRTMMSKCLPLQSK